MSTSCNHHCGKFFVSVFDTEPGDWAGFSMQSAVSSAGGAFSSATGVLSARRVGVVGGQTAVISGREEGLCESRHGFWSKDCAYLPRLNLPGDKRTSLHWRFWWNGKKSDNRVSSGMNSLIYPELGRRRFDRVMSS